MTESGGCEGREGVWGAASSCCSQFFIKIKKYVHLVIKIVVRTEVLVGVYNNYLNKYGLKV